MAPAGTGTSPRDPTYMIRPFRTSMSPSEMAAAPVPSQMRAPTSAVTPAWLADPLAWAADAVPGRARSTTRPRARPAKIEPMKRGERSVRFLIMSVTSVSIVSRSLPESLSPPRAGRQGSPTVGPKVRHHPAECASPPARTPESSCGTTPSLPVQRGCVHPFRSFETSSRRAVRLNGRKKLLRVITLPFRISTTKEFSRE